MGVAAGIGGAKAASVAVAAAVKRRRPVASSAVDFRTVAIARSGKEYAVAVGTGDAVTVYAVLGGQSPSAVGAEFELFGLCRHAPGAAPFYMGHIVLGIKDSFVIHSAIFAIGAILGQRVLSTIAPLISFPTVIIFFLGFTPSVVTAEFLGRRCTNVTSCHWQRM